nr:ribosomal protein L13 [Cyanidiaceae sp.]
MESTVLLPKSQNSPVWYLIDAHNKILGKIATKAATILMGKNRSGYFYNLLSSNFVIIINSGQASVTGKKNNQKLYKRYSNKPGGTKVENFNHLKNRVPNRIIEHAVRGMLPKSILGRQMFSHLKVYTGSSHPHLAQNPIQLNI